MKKLGILFLTVLLVLAFVSCGKEKDSNTITEPDYSGTPDFSIGSSPSSNFSRFLADIYGDKAIITGVSLNGNIQNIISVPESILGYEVVGIRDFKDDHLYKKFIIPKHISYVSGSLLAEEIVVDEENPYFTSVDGVLFSKDKKTLVSIPFIDDGYYAVPEGVERIADGALSFSTGATFYIDISATVSEVSSLAFTPYRNYSIYITVDENNPYFCSVDGVLYSKDMTKLIAARKDFTIPNGVTEICDYAIGVPTKEQHFVNRTGGPARILGKITIPASVKTIGDNAFATCYIDGFEVDENNPYFCDVDGVLFSKDKTELIKFPILTNQSHVTYDIPSGVKKIRNYAFYGATNTKYYGKSILDITLPEGVEYIGDYAFCGCNSALSLLFLPESLTHIGNYAFAFVGGFEKAPLSDVFESAYGSKYQENLDKLFENRNNLVLPKNLKYIGDCAFEYVFTETVTVPSATTHIGTDAFGQYSQNIHVNPDNQNYASVDGVLFNKDKTELLEYPFGREMESDNTEEKFVYAIPSTVTTVHPHTFTSRLTWYTIHFDVLYIPASVVKLPFGAISAECYEVAENNTVYCSVNGGLYSKDKTIVYTSLDEVIPYGVTTMMFVAENIPASVKVIKNTICYTDLSSVSVDRHNEYYADIDGVLFNKEKTELIKFPNGKSNEYEIPSGVTTIKNGAFVRCGNANAFIRSDFKLTIPESVTNIEPMAILDIMGKLTIVCHKDSAADEFFRTNFNGNFVTIEYID